MIGEIIRDVVVIHSLIHNLLVLLCNSQAVVEKMIGEIIRDVVVIHSITHNLLVLLCNSLAEVYRK